VNPALLTFLDANVIFSAALGGQTFVELWAALAGAGFSACTSPQCVDEVRRNLTLKRPAALPQLEAALESVLVLPAPTQLADWAAGKLPEDDGWVLAGALQSGAQVLLTGNTRHFGWMMERSDLPIRVRTVRAFLDELAAPPP
jgi:predicted nucleic acid-binding protein